MGFTDQQHITNTVQQCLEAIISPMYAAKTIYEGLGGFDSVKFNHRYNNFKLYADGVVHDLFPRDHLSKKEYSLVELLAVELSRYIFLENPQAVVLHLSDGNSTKHRAKQFRKAYRF